MAKPLTRRELLKLQIQTYDFYAGLIDRAVGGAHTTKLPRWDEERAEEYKRLVEQLRAQLDAMSEEEANAPVVEPNVTVAVESPTSGGGGVSAPEIG